MLYNKNSNGKEDFWYPDPKNWVELAFLIHNDISFMYYDPDGPEPEDTSILDMF